MDRDQNKKDPAKQIGRNSQRLDFVRFRKLEQFVDCCKGHHSRNEGEHRDWSTQDEQKKDWDEHYRGKNSLEEFQSDQLRNARKDWDSFKPP